jgi:hypothetical protein
VHWPTRADDRSGSKPAVRPCRLQCPVCPRADMARRERFASPGFKGSRKHAEIRHARCCERCKRVAASHLKGEQRSRAAFSAAASWRSRSAPAATSAAASCADAAATASPPGSCSRPSAARISREIIPPEGRRSRDRLGGREGRRRGRPAPRPARHPRRSFEGTVLPRGTVSGVVPAGGWLCEGVGAGQADDDNADGPDETYAGPPPPRSSDHLVVTRRGGLRRSRSGGIAMRGGRRRRSERSGRGRLRAGRVRSFD